MIFSSSPIPTRLNFLWLELNFHNAVLEENHAKKDPRNVLAVRKIPLLKLTTSYF